MKFCSCFILVSLLSLSFAGETCYTYDSYYGYYYTSYCSGYCAGSTFSEYCLYYNDRESGSRSSITIGASVGGSIVGIIFFVCCCFCVAKTKN